MKVAMVSEHASPLAALGGVDAGGQNVHVAELGSALADLGHDVTVYTRRDAVELPPQVQVRAGLRVVHLDAGPPTPVPKDDLLPHIPALAAQLHRRWRDAPPDIVHAHFWMSGLASVTAATPCAVPVVQTFHALGSVKRRHQGEADTSPAERIDLERGLGESVARVIAACTDEVRELRAMGVRRSVIDIVASGVDLRLFTPDGAVSASNGRPRLLTLGRLVPRKGVDDAIRMLGQLDGDAELIVAGGPERSALRGNAEAVRLMRLTEDLGLAGRVRFVGCVTRNDLPALIRSARAVVCLPWYEPFGIVPLEAMACGVPVIGTAVGGLIDTVADGVTGLLVPPHDPMAAAHAARRLLDDPATRRDFGEAARVRASRYTWRNAAVRIEGSYRRAVLDAGWPTSYREVAG